MSGDKYVDVKVPASSSGVSDADLRQVVTDWEAQRGGVVGGREFAHDQHLARNDCQESDHPVDDEAHSRFATLSKNSALAGRMGQNLSHPLFYLIMSSHHLTSQIRAIRRRINKIDAGTSNEVGGLSGLETFQFRNTLEFEWDRLCADRGDFIRSVRLDVVCVESEAFPGVVRQLRGGIRLVSEWEIRDPNLNLIRGRQVRSVRSHATGPATRVDLRDIGAGQLRTGAPTLIVWREGEDGTRRWLVSAGLVLRVTSDAIDLRFPDGEREIPRGRVFLVVST